MSGQEQLSELAERRRLLVLEADLHRSLIAVESENLRKKLGFVLEVGEHVAVGGPWLAAGSAVAGWFAVRHWRTAARWFPTALAALRLVRWIRSK